MAEFNPYWRSSMNVEVERGWENLTLFEDLQRNIVIYVILGLGKHRDLYVCVYILCFCWYDKYLHSCTCVSITIEGSNFLIQRSRRCTNTYVFSFIKFQCWTDRTKNMIIVSVNIYIVYIHNIEQMHKMFQFNCKLFCL